MGLTIRYPQNPLLTTKGIILYVLVLFVLNYLSRSVHICYLAIISQSKIIGIARSVSLSDVPALVGFEPSTHQLCNIQILLSRDFWAFVIH